MTLCVISFTAKEGWCAAVAMSTAYHKSSVFLCDLCGEKEFGVPVRELKAPTTEDTEAHRGNLRPSTKDRLSVLLDSTSPVRGGVPSYVRLSALGRAR